MGFSKKTQVDFGLDSEGKKWVVAGMAIRTSLKPISTKPRAKANENDDNVDTDREEEQCCTTPTAKESRIPERLPCPPAPRKPRPSSSSSSSSSRCNYNGVREFFNPPDLESVFKCYVEKAN